jgi:hypothetical protein
MLGNHIRSRAGRAENRAAQVLNPQLHPAMQLTSYGFILVGPGLSADRHSTLLRSDRFSARVVGVGSRAEAEAAAAELVAGGVQVIELCGGFDGADAEAIAAAAGTGVPVGLVRFEGEQLSSLESFLAAPIPP